MYALQDIPLFSKLSEAHLIQLQSQMHIHHYEKESIVFYEGEKSEYLHILLEGTVRLYKTTPKGTQIHMHYFSSPEIIALFASFEHIPFPATCAFVDEGTIGLLSLQTLYKCMQNVDFSVALVSALSRRMKLLSQLLHKETVYSSEAKIADLIWSNPSVFQRLKNNEIAAILNMTPETLSRILTKMKKEGIICIEAHVVSILDEDALLDIMETNKIKKSS